MASNIQPTGLDWKNLPDKTTPISAENLNKMANTIDDLVEAVNPLNTVEANPTGTPTEGLEKVEIDGTLYEVKGGHKILNDSGTTLTQKDNLQFKGTYVEDDQTNNKTVVNVIRQMTLAEFNQLTSEQKKGLIDVTDQQGHSITASDIPYDSNNTVKDMLNAREITNADLSAFADSTKIKIHRMDKIVQIAFYGAKLSSSVGRYAEIIKNLPANLQGVYVGGFIIKLSSGTSVPTAVYLNPLSQKLQIDASVSTTDEIYGSFQYICQ